MYIRLPYRFECSILWNSNTWNKSIFVCCWKWHQSHVPIEKHWKGDKRICFFLFFKKQTLVTAKRKPKRHTKLLCCDLFSFINELTVFLVDFWLRLYIRNIFVNFLIPKCAARAIQAIIWSEINYIPWRYSTKRHCQRSDGNIFVSHASLLWKFICRYGISLKHAQVVLHKLKSMWTCVYGRFLGSSKIWTVVLWNADNRRRNKYKRQIVPFHKSKQFLLAPQWVHIRMNIILKKLIKKPAS